MTPINGQTPIAEDLVLWVLPSGERRPGRIAICAPEPDTDSDTMWTCWWFLEGLKHEPRQALGDGSLQALMLTLKTIGYELHAFIARGGTVLMPGHEEAGSSAVLVSLRVLLRQPGDPLFADPVLAELDAEIAKGGEDEETGL